MLSAIASQIEAALRESESPAATLVEGVHSMGQATQTLTRCLFDFSGSPAKVFQDLMLLHDDLHGRAAEAATAVQFHDRLVQRLNHVCISLSTLAEFLASCNAGTSAAEWSELGERLAKQQMGPRSPGKVELF